MGEMNRITIKSKLMKKQINKKIVVRIMKMFLQLMMLMS